MIVHRCKGCRAAWLSPGIDEDGWYESIRCTCPVGSEPEFEVLAEVQPPTSVRCTCPAGSRRALHHFRRCPVALPENDPRYLNPFMAGMFAARMALVRHGWKHAEPLSIQEAVTVIDRERLQSVALLINQHADTPSSASSPKDGPTQ
ncbi:hypothetical protein [Saccharothrix sp. HUAS TT1]|uniref:hypothetical protein n=1 Tax=unclassified Saccharothrix TaxID=2593673 RepID=UPI00345C5C65